MQTIPDFEDLLSLFHHHQVRYVIIGGLAFIFHAKPRYTKDIDLWVQNEPENIKQANRALMDFGSPTLLAEDEPDQVVQIGIAPHRVDILVALGAVDFEVAWRKRIQRPYGDSPANWIDLESLLRIKSAINHPRHQEDARVLRELWETQTGNNGTTQ